MGQNWYDNTDISLDNYVREILVYNYPSKPSEFSTVLTGSAYTHMERNLNKLENPTGEGEAICVGFKRDLLEPIGYQKIWMAWEFYDDSEYCAQLNYCLTRNRAEGAPEPIVYYNGITFFE